MSEGSTANNPTNTREAVDYEFTIGTLSTKLHEVVDEEVRKLTESKVENIGDKIRTLLQSSAYRLLEKNGNVLKPAVTTEDNEKIIEIVNWLKSLEAHYGSTFVYAIGLYFNPSLYDQKEIRNILNTAPSLEFIQGVLRAGAGKILFESKSNQEITEICTELVKKWSGQSSEKSDEENREEYIGTSAHNGYQVWDIAKDFIKLDENLDKTIEIGESLGDEFVWEKIIKERLAVLKSLSVERRVKIAQQVVQSIQRKRGLPVVDFESGTSFVHQLRSLGFGQQLAHKLDAIFDLVP